MKRHKELYQALGLNTEDNKIIMIKSHQLTRLMKSKLTLVGYCNLDRKYLASPITYPGIVSSIPARSHNFVEIGHEINSMVILLHARCTSYLSRRLTHRLDMTITVDWDVKQQTKQAKEYVCKTLSHHSRRLSSVLSSTYVLWYIQLQTLGTKVRLLHARISLDWI